MLLSKNNRLILCHVCGMISSFLFTVSCQLLFECTAVNVQLKISN